MAGHLQELIAEGHPELVRVFLLTGREANTSSVEPAYKLAYAGNPGFSHGKVLAQLAQHARTYMAGSRPSVALVTAFMTTKSLNEIVARADELQDSVRVAGVACVPDRNGFHAK